MKHRKLMALLALVLTALVLFTACGEEEQKSEKKDDPTVLSKKIRVVAQKGAPGIKVFRNMGDNYEIKTYKKIGDLRSAIKEGDYDAAILSTGIAGEMYERTKKGLVEVSPVSLDGIWVVANGYNKNDFRLGYMINKNVVCMDKHSTADQVWQQVMNDGQQSIAAVKMKYVNSYEASVKPFASWSALVICAEPYASRLTKLSEVYKILDLAEIYRENGHGQVPTDVLVVSKKMAKHRTDDVRIMKNEYETALGTVRKSKANLVFYNQSDRGIQLLREYNKTVGNKASYFEE